MRITLEFPEDAFLTPKTLQQVAEEVRQAAVRFWVARGELAQEAVNDVTTTPPPQEEGTLYDLLMLGPNVGDDADFERPLDYGRELPEWDT